jgi:flagellar M-ring protein FliF
VDKYIQQILTFLRGLSLRQRILLGAATVLVAASIALFVRLTQGVDYSALYSGLSPQDAQTIVASLITKNIPYQLSTDQATVSVPTDQLDKARLLLAAEGEPQTGRLGFEIFDKTNWAGSDFSEQVNYQRALEGELERTIQTLGNVESVRVHLVMPHDSLFSSEERAAKAAVVLRLRGGTLTDDEVNAVTHLVASAVDNLSPENVTLIGADGRTPLVAQGHGGIQGGDASQGLETTLAEKLVATLTPIVGQDHVKASVNVDYDQSSGDTTQEVYDPTNPVLVSSQIQEENFGGSPPAGIPGTPSNVPATPATSGTTGARGAQPAANAKTATPQQNQANNPMVSISSESEGQHSESKTYAVSKTVRHTIDPAGRVQKIAAAVLVDDAAVQTTDAQGKTVTTHRKRTPDEMKQIEDLARAAMGFDAARGDVLSVENVPFVSPPPEQLAPAPVTQRVRLVVEDWMWLIRYAALLLLFGLIYLFFLRPVKNQLVESFRQLTSPPVPALAGAGAGGESGALSGASGLGPAAELEGQLSQTNSQVERVVKMKRHLADRVKNDPIAASQLVRQWINEQEP